MWGLGEMAGGWERWLGAGLPRERHAAPRQGTCGARKGARAARRGVRWVYSLAVGEGSVPGLGLGSVHPLAVGQGSVLVSQLLGELSQLCLGAMQLLLPCVGVAVGLRLQGGTDGLVTHRRTSARQCVFTCEMRHPRSASPRSTTKLGLSFKTQAVPQTTVQSSTRL